MALPKLYELITWVNDTTPALNEDNLNAMSQALDDIDDRVIDLAGTIMEDVPQIIEDMAILEPAIESIDENVARAEAAAESAEQYAEEIAPPIEVVKDFAPIITIEDAINKPVKDLKVKVEPVQDLHGYTKPWVGGAGKNKVEITFTDGTVQNMVTFSHVKDKDGNIIGVKAHGTANATCIMVIGLVRLEEGTSVIINGCPSGGGTSTYYLTLNSMTAGESDLGNGSIVWNLRSNKNAYIVIQNGQTLNNVIFKPMVRLSSDTDTTFAPYSNISPITGHSEAKVTRAAHNLLPLSLAEMKTLNTVGTWSGNTYTRADKTFKVNTDGNGAVTSVVLGGTASANTEFILHRGYELPKGNYTFSKGNTSVTQFFIKKLNGSAHQDVGSLATITTGGEATREVDYSNYDHLVYGIFCASGNALTDIFEPMVRLSTDTESSFEPYNGTIYTIDLDGTRYGGVLDVTSGVLTVLCAFVEYDGSNDEDWVSAGDNQFYISKTDAMNKAYIITNEYEGVFVTSWGNLQNGQISAHPSSANNILRFRDDSLADVTALRAKFTTTPLQVVYELATPQTITLTPREVTLLWQYNTLFADTGDLSLTYDASGVLRIANAKLDIDTFKSVVAASSDFADFKTRVAAL